MESKELRNITETKDLTDHLIRQRDNAQNTIAKFADNLATDPTYAMSWSDDAFTAAGKIQVLSIAIELLKDGTSEDELKLVALREFGRRARNPAASSSAPSNLTDQRIEKAWADLYEQIGGVR